MNKSNQFFKKIYSSPSLLWKACAGVLFLGLAIVILFVHSLTGNIGNSTRYSFAGLLIVYALFRFGTFYVEFKREDRDE